MTEKHKNTWPDKISPSQTDTVDLFDLVNHFWRDRVIIVSIVAVSALASVFYALSLTNVFRAEALLAPAEVRQSSNPLLGELGGAASLIGINIPGQAGNQVDNAIAILNSREFARQFIGNHDLAPMLMAGKWDESSRNSYIDNSVYDESTQSWVDKAPTDWETFQRFRSILSIGKDRNTGLVTVAIEWHDPVQARDWVNLMVSDVNELIKQQDLEESTSAIEFLRAQLANTQLVEMQRVFYQLIESQTRIVMLADVRDDYVFKVIDPAVVPEDKVAPRRSLICLIGTAMGLLLAFLVAFFRWTMRSEGRND